MSDSFGALIPFFRELNRSQLNKIEKISRIYHCKNGDNVFLQGEFCQNWVIINSGSFLARVKDDTGTISEKVLLEGESFDFMSTIESSVTTQSLEAIGNSSIVVIDILGLKKLGKKNPVLISLIKEQLLEDEAKLWSNKFLKREHRVKDSFFRIRSSYLLLFFKSLIPLLLTFVISVTIRSLVVFNLPLTLFILLSFWSILLMVLFFISRLTVIEVNREFAIKRSLDLKSWKAVNSSVPLEKVTGTNIKYKSRLSRIFKIGDITLESATEDLTICGVFKPENILSGIDTFKGKTININKAIEVSSFKSLYCEQNGLFFIDSQLETYGDRDFSFRKSILYFFIRAIPPFVIFALSSIGLFLVFERVEIYLFNVISILYMLWHYIDWINDKYAFEGEKVIDIEKKPLWGKEIRKEADITSVQSIKKVQKNFFEMLFNFGSIEVETLGDKMVYPFINNPDKVIENLYLVKQYYHSKKESMDKLNRQEEFLNYTKYYQELSGK